MHYPKVAEKSVSFITKILLRSNATIIALKNDKEISSAQQIIELRKVSNKRTVASGLLQRDCIIGCYSFDIDL
jgi:hypothetical protein